MEEIMNDNRYKKSISGAESRITELSAGETSERSIGDDTSATFFQFQDLHLYLRQKKESQSNRAIIPSTKAERMSYFRAYVSSPNRKQILIMQHAQFKKFLWYYVFNVFLKSFPHTFVHLFLASYAPDEHIFLPKMVPICQGCKYTFVIAAFLEILIYADTMVTMMVYTVSSILHTNPWNRCVNKTYIDPVYKYVVHCYNMEEFSKKFVNDTPIFKYSAYISSENEVFQLAQLAYYRIYKNAFVRNLCYFIFIWITAAICHKRVFTETFWKILHRCQWIVNGIDIASFIFLAGVYFQSRIDQRKEVEVPVFPLADEYWKIDLDMLVESTTTPPTVQILTARSTQPIRPSEDSAMIMASNAICFILRGLLISRVKKYCESLLNAPLFQTESNRFSWFFLYTIFFATFPFGELFTMGFFAMYFVTEMMVFIVTYQCLIEMMIHEWKFMKRWCIASALTTVAIFVYCTSNYLTTYILFIYGTGIATLFEIIFLYLLYPLSRLIDDYTFHYGVQLTTLRILTLRIVPFYYSLKFYWLMSGFLNVLTMTVHPVFPMAFKWTWIIIVAPLCLGFLMVMYRYVIVQRKDWRFMFRPVPHWGPKDFQSRQLRKQFDSRNYIGSQYPRLLSRYLLRKGEAESYKLELRYENDNAANKGVQEQDLNFINEKRA